MHGIPICFHHISLQHNKFMWFTSEIRFFMHRTPKTVILVWVYNVWVYEAVLSRHVQRVLMQKSRSIFYYVLDLLFGARAFEMHSVFPYVSRDEVFIWDILLGRKPYIKVMTTVWILRVNWALIACHTCGYLHKWRYHLSKLPRAELMTFQLLGSAPILGVNTNSRPTKLWLTSTITEEIAQPLTFKICFRYHEWL